MKHSVLLAVLDGWGIRGNTFGNAIRAAHTPTFDKLDREYPHIKLYASGSYVGLPDGQMGNSEVGHLNLGAGRVVFQELPRITASIKDGSFFKNSVINKAIEHSRTNNSSLHLIGLLSDGGVHSHIDHLFAILDLAKHSKVDRVYIHAFLDGRDVSPKSAMRYIRQLTEKMSSLKIGKISTIAGRYYGMDRDNRWDRVEKSYNAIVYGEGDTINNAWDVIEKSYKHGVSDEFAVPAVIDPEDKRSLIREDDSIIFFNFRADRMRQIIRPFIEKEFNNFKRKRFFTPYITCFTEYDTKFKLPVAFPPYTLECVLGEIISKNNLKQVRIAETEKYAHVTFFFNGGIEKSFKGEDRILVPSPKVSTYDQKPEMSAYEVTEEVIRAAASEKYDFILVNYANPDMVGHTGCFDASVRAVETVDTCIGKIIRSVKFLGGDMLITADHGNIEKMKNPETGSSVTSHTSNPVPFYVITDRIISLKKEGILADAAPTILALMDIPIPPQMTGKSLIIKNAKQQIL